MSESLLEPIPMVARRFGARLAAVVAIALAVTVLAPAQAAQVSESEPGQIVGTVTSVDGDVVAGATVVLGDLDTGRRTVVTDDSGFFKFDKIRPGVSYRVVISAEDFADWTSAPITVAPGEIKMLGAVELTLAPQQTVVRVTGNPVEIATEQMQVEETQRVFGVIPNFYVSYEGDKTAPLTPKMKFKLALKVSRDPVTIAGIAVMAGIRQATNYPDYGPGMTGYGERFAATAGPVVTDIMIGGAILPSLLHQDPRYFHQGTGSTASRLRHAIFAPFFCKGDNGRSQPNYSSLGGDLASAALSNLYYPQSNRGAGLVFGTFAIGTAERIASTVAQEFVLDKFTHRPRNEN